MPTVLIVDDNMELATLLAVAVEAHGFTPVVVHTGREALETIQREPPDAALVDLLLPDMRGTEVLQSLATRNVPALAMSGVFRGDRFAREATETYGAKAFFEKPFAARDMMAVLTELLRAAMPARSDELEELRLEEALEPQETPPPQEPRRREVPLLDDLPSAATTGFFVSETPEASGDSEPLPQASLGALVYSNRDPWTPTRPIRPQTAARGFARAGDLSKTSVPRLLTGLYQGQQTGELRVRRGSVIKVVAVENGRPIYAASNLASERFARFSVRQGRLAAEQLETVQQESQRAGMRTGEAMIALGLITEEERRELVLQQVKEIVWSLFDWSEGEYSFALGRHARRDLVRLQLFPGDLILDGMRRMTLVKLRERVASDLRVSPCADPPYQLHELTLSGPEALLLAYADGAKTVEDLSLLSELDERSALALVHGLMELGILEPRRQLPSDRRVVLV